MDKLKIDPEIKISSGLPMAWVDTRREPRTVLETQGRTFGYKKTEIPHPSV